MSGLRCRISSDGRAHLLITEFPGCEAEVSLSGYYSEGSAYACDQCGCGWWIRQEGVSEVVHEGVHEALACQEEGWGD